MLQVIEFEGSNDHGSTSLGADQNTQSTNVTETSASYTQTDNIYDEPLGDEQSNEREHEYVSEQKSTASASAPEITISETSSNYEQELKIQENEQPTTIPSHSQPNIHLTKPQVNVTNADKKKCHVEPLFVSDFNNDNRLTIEDIYIEAMTLAAEIRIHHRQLDERGRAELTRIMKFCHDALHEKLVIASLAKRGHRTNRQGNWR